MGNALPILYEYDTVSFGLDNGIGALADCTECIVNETLNEEFELTMKYPVNGVLFNELRTGRILYAKPSPYREAEPFRIYRFGKVMRDSIEFAARHLSYDLSGVILKPIVPFIYRPCEIMETLNDDRNYYIYNDKYVFETDLYDDYDPDQTYMIGDYVMYPTPSRTEQISKIYKCKEDNVSGVWNASKWDLIDNKITTEKPVTVRSIFGTGENTMLGSYGGEFKYEYDPEDEKIHIKLLQSRGEDRGVFFRYGIDLIDLNQEKNISEMYTGVLPFYSSNNNIVVGVNPIIELPIGEQTVSNILLLDVTGDFSQTPTNDQVTETGKKYIAINEYDKPKVSIDIKQPDLISLEHRGQFIIELGDRVNIFYEKLGIDMKAKIVSTSYDVLNNRYTEIQIGDVKNTIVRTIAQQSGAITNITNNYYSGGGGSGGSSTAVFA